MFTMENSDFTVIVSVAVTSIFIWLQWVITNSELIKEFLFGERPTEADEINYFLFTKYSGLLLLGVFPCFVISKLLPHYSFSDYGLSNEVNLVSFYWILALGTLIIILNWIIAKRKRTHFICPQILKQEWNSKRIGIYSVSIAVYLFSVELLFRGILFFPLVHTTGVLLAVFINVSIYTLSLSPKGVNEVMGILLFSLVLCVVTLHTGTIWVAFFLHVVHLLSNGLIVFLLHPELKVVKERNRINLSKE
jgi:membrane protease YdiL (CAAX protease family)